MRLLPTPRRDAGDSTRPNLKGGATLTDAVRSLEASSPGSEGSTLASASRPPGSASTTSTAEPCSSATGPECRSTPTCASSEPTPHESTCSTADTPASRSASQASAKARTTPGISGLSSPDSFAYYDPESSSLRTSQATFDLGFTPSLPTLPAWGWMSAGELFERPMSEPLTSEHDSSSLLGTPNSHERTHSPRSVDHGVQLANQVALLPTPCSQEPGGTPERFLERKNRDGANRTAENGNLSLTHTVQLLPTPTTDDANNVTRASGTFDSLARTAHNLLPTPMANQENPGAGGELRAALTHGPTRRNETGVDTMGRPNRGRKLLPTPMASDAANARNTTAGRTKVQPSVASGSWTGTDWDSLSDLVWKGELSGASTNQPSDDGNPSTDPPHGQLTIEAD